MAESQACFRQQAASWQPQQHLILFNVTDNSKHIAVVMLMSSMPLISQTYATYYDISFSALICHEQWNTDILQ